MYENYSDLVERYRPDPAPYRASAENQLPGWLDELDLKPAPPHLRMGTHSLDLNDWFVIDEHFEAEKIARQELIDEQRQHVFDLLPSAEAAAEETLALVRRWLQERGRPTETTDENPLAAAGQLVQDDLCLMIQRDGDWHLDGGILCFPSMWRLSEKIGKPTGQVHAPVNHYADELSTKVDRFFDRLTPERPVWRRNLSLKPTNAMYLPMSKAEVKKAQIEVANDGSPYWMRTERQTLRRLPKTGAILFTIRTQIAPISVLLRRPDLARELLTMYQSWDEQLGRFKMVDSDIGRSLLPWLARVSGGVSGA
jgi:dimethylamine monooxygenase subunit A